MQCRAQDLGASATKPIMCASALFGRSAAAIGVLSVVSTRSVVVRHPTHC